MRPGLKGVVATPDGCSCLRGSQLPSLPFGRIENLTSEMGILRGIGHSLLNSVDFYLPLASLICLTRSSYCRIGKPRSPAAASLASSTAFSAAFRASSYFFILNRIVASV